LEHSRIYYFRNATGEEVIMAGSADWMQRNFYRRIESVFPVEDPRQRKRVVREILGAYLKDNTFACELQSDGSYKYAERKEGESPFAAQSFFSRRAEYLRQKTETAAQD
jgi:polyphosphate kinase